MRAGRDAQAGEMSDNEVDFSLLVGREVPTRYFAKGETIFREGEQGDEFFVVVRGQVEIKSGNKLDATIAYPPGEKFIDGKDIYYIYQNEVEIRATVKRSAGDTSPLEVKVNFMTCNDKTGICLPPESVVLQVK